ncbi:isoprenylcysteine carboxylmethyltransferase family protein [Leucobacter sp. CSA2]|uniref:Isoprenylcysteine carboxylmethyltransferase family protein n=1 Tax=Leucobacter edaphi TaxID=2796472 RepID=A0A934UY56_9MICO|nr:isoprenylcysteine carboxylmethyltransferase family protein [Leucobacter edaphi]MBK0422088.1 isoprenylcysteine carboxylmethyltransferase family protein [Leucobacter edaphi]
MPLHTFPTAYLRWIGRGYFAAQAAAGAIWWITVFTWDFVREATLGGFDPVLVAVLDVPLFVIASALAAIAPLGGRWAVRLATGWTALVSLGMGAYATITGLAGWGALLMLAAAACSVSAALLIELGRIPTELLLTGPFRITESRPRRTAGHVLLTAAQLVVFWGIALVLVPLGIAWVEARWGLSAPVPAWVRIAGWVLLAAASALGLWSAGAMSSRGEGTPLPIATARRMVVSGPYRFVRNPMAVAGIAQGVAVGLILGSWLVVVYALAGSLLWNWGIRPVEEADLERRFGAEYVAYRDSVRCWVPSAPREHSTT